MDMDGRITLDNALEDQNAINEIIHKYERRHHILFDGFSFNKYYGKIWA